MKKIIQVAMGEAWLRKAHSIRTFHNCKHLAKKHKIKIVYPSSPINLRNSEKIRKFYKKSNLELKFLPKTFFSSVLTLMGLPGRYFFYLIDRLFFSFFAFIYILVSETDIIYLADPIITFFFVTSRRIHRKKIIYEMHGIEHIRFEKASSFVRMLSKGMEIRALKGSDALITISFWLKNYAKNFNRRVLFFPTGFEREIFKKGIKNSSRKKLGIPKEHKILMYSGINLREGLEDLIYSMKYFSKNKNIKLYIVGGLPKQVIKFRRISKELNLENNIIFIRSIPHEKNPDYLNASDFLISPYSRNKNTEYFASPLKVFEYMAVEKPIIATNVGCLKGILEDGKNAILVEAENPKSMAEGINKVLKNNKLAKKIAKNAYNDSKKYTYKKRAEEISKLIERL